jgi:hypothetical protein
MIRDSFGGAGIRGEAATLPIVGIHVTEKGEESDTRDAVG